MKITETSHFKRRRKKLHPKEKADLDQAVKTLIKNPTIGEMKTGDLAGTLVYKFKYKVQEYLLAYYVNEEETEIRLRELLNPE